MRGVTVNDTVNAAASAIQSSETRPTQSSSLQKRRWRTCLNISICFGTKKQNKRVNDSVVVPEPGFSRTDDDQLSTRMSQPVTIVFPFIAPPSSPASFFQSEPPSGAHTPGGGGEGEGDLSFTQVSGGMYSPSGPRNMFAIGPYAHETQLVSPPVFSTYNSTYNTEPSTAPFTPPPESVHLTTPSSPEVPYARLFGSGNRNSVVPYEFQGYQLYPGSPLGGLKSPGSGIFNSGTSSPFIDGNGEFIRGGTGYIRFPISGKVSPCQWESRTGSGAMTPSSMDPRSCDGHMLTSGKVSPCEWESRTGSGVMTPDPMCPRSRDGYPLSSGKVSPCLLGSQTGSGVPTPDHVGNGKEDQRHLFDHRVSFEVTPEQVVRCVERRRFADAANGHERYNDVAKDDAQRHEKHRSTSTLGSVKEFNFDSTDGAGSEGPIKNWSFFPMMQPGVS